MLDGRTAEEFDGEPGHLAGARLLPLQSLDARLDELAAYRNQAIALVCQTDRRSARAARLPAGQGFSDLYGVRRGLLAWHAAGLPVQCD